MAGNTFLVMNLAVFSDRARSVFSNALGKKIKLFYDEIIEDKSNKKILFLMQCLNC